MNQAQSIRQVTPAVFGVWHPVKGTGVILDAYEVGPGAGFNLRVAEVDNNGERAAHLENFASQDELIDRWNAVMGELLSAGYHDSLLVPPADGVLFIPRSGPPN